MKRNKTFLRIIALIFTISLCISVFAISSSAFFLSNISKIDGANVKIYADGHMDNIYGDDFDFVYITPLQTNAATSNGVDIDDARQLGNYTPAWDDYVRFQNFDDYMTSAYRKIASIEFVVVYVSDPEKYSYNRFDVVSEGNYFFPQDLAVYYEDGLRALYNPTTGLYSFSFLTNYWYFNTASDEIFSLAAIVYHNASDASHADSDKYITRAEYNAKCTELAEVKRQLTEAQNEYDLKCSEYDAKLADMQDDIDEKQALLDEQDALISEDYEKLKALEAEIEDLEWTNLNYQELNDELYETNKSLEEKIANLRSEKDELETENLNLVEINGELRSTKEFLQNKVNELKADLSNNGAVKNLFQGAYEAVHNFCQDIFGLSFGGVSVGSVVSIVFVMAIVFFLVKILRG